MPHRLVAALLALAAAWSVPAAAMTLFESPGLTQADDPVECVEHATYRRCASDAAGERLLSHDALPPAERAPLDFELLLPPAPTDGTPDGEYPLVVFLHGWNGSRSSLGGGLEAELVPYAEAGYAVLAYSARAWGQSCGPSQRDTPACEGQWNHLADVRFEVRDTQYLAGLLADEPSDDGTPLVDGQRVGVTGVSYGGGQSTTLASLRDRVVDPDGSVRPWQSPAGRPMRIAAAAPFWAWSDLASALLPNGGTLDHASNNAYRGPLGDLPYGVMKTSYVSGLYATGRVNSVYAPPGEQPALDLWYQLVSAGEPYTEADVGPIVDELVAFHSGLTWLDPDVAPAPTIFNSGWSDDLFPVSEPLRWMHRARALHPDVAVALVASDYGHARARSNDAAWARSTARAWFDHWLLGVGEPPGPVVRAREQRCDATPGLVFEADDWETLSAGELRHVVATPRTLLASAGPSAESGSSHDPIAGGDACARVDDAAVAGAVSIDLPPPAAGGSTVLGSPTVIADLSVSGAPPEQAVIVARLLDVGPDGREQLLARGPLRPRSNGRAVWQLTPIAHHVGAGHRLQLELVGHEAPTHRQSNAGFSIELAGVELRVPVHEAPDGGQVLAPAAAPLPPGYELADACRQRSCAAGRVADGATVPGEPLTIRRLGGSITLRWGGSCDPTDADFAVYEGRLGAFDSHLPLACSTGGERELTVASSSGDHYYLVVARDEIREGSAGRAGGGAERPRSGAPCLNRSVLECP